MKKLLFAVFAVGIFSFAAMAQNTSYAGTWTLDASKSKLNARARIESITLTVTESGKDITVNTETKFQPRDDAAGGGGRGMRMNFGDGPTTYTLDGKEVKTEVESQMGKVPVTHKGSKESDGSLKLSTSRTFNGQNGEMTITTKDKWSLSADGKTLTIERESESPRGTNSTTLVFNKG